MSEALSRVREFVQVESTDCKPKMNETQVNQEADERICSSSEQICAVGERKVEEVEAESGAATQDQPDQKEEDNMKTQLAEDEPATSEREDGQSEAADEDGGQQVASEEELEESCSRDLAPDLCAQSEQNGAQEVNHGSRAASSSSGNSSGEVAELRELIDEDTNDSEQDDFCSTELASNSTLRKLKLSAIEDALICEQSRVNLDVARRLFDGLAQQQVGADTFRSDTSKAKRSGSLSSTESENQLERQQSEAAYDIKIVRRSGSSLSSSNFRRTLVCSLSPTSQLLASSNTSGSAGSNSDLGLPEEDPLYPIDGDEIRQCRAAFRENKRLIEQQQKRATLMMSSNDTIKRQESPSSRWSNRLNRDYIEQSQVKCSHCKLRLYPIDKMELDFTRATLNIHRNCFKCQVCSTLLR